MIPWKLVERAVRALPLLVLPIVIAPAIVLYFASLKHDEYRSTATMWVQDVPGINVNTLGNDIEFTSPAGRQRGVLSELLSTQAFLEDVAVNAGLIAAPTDTTSASSIGRSRALSVVASSVSVRAVGNNLIEISATTASPGVSQALVEATVDRYNERVSGEMQRRSDASIEYYTQQLGVAQEELVTRENELQVYLDGHPGADDPRNFDREFNRLLSRVNAQQGVVDNLQQAILQAHQATASASEALAATLELVDPASTPTGPLLPSRTAKYGYPLVALAIGATISVTYLYIVYRTDHTVLTSEDLPHPGVPLLGFVPEVKPTQNVNWFSRLRRLVRREPDFARRIAASIAVRATERERS